MSEVAESSRYEHGVMDDVIPDWSCGAFIRVPMAFDWPSGEPITYVKWVRRADCPEHADEVAE